MLRRLTMLLVAVCACSQHPAQVDDDRRRPVSALTAGLQAKIGGLLLESERLVSVRRLRSAFPHLAPEATSSVPLESVANAPYVSSAVLRGSAEAVSQGQGGATLRQAESACTRHSDCEDGFFCLAGVQICAACWKCTSNGAAVDGRCPADCALHSSSQSTDTEPPELSWAFVDNRGDTVGGNTVTFASEKRYEIVWVDLYMYIQDEGSGIKGAAMFFTSTTQSGETYGIKVMSYAERDLSSGSTNAGVMKSSFWFEIGDESGRWALRQLQLQDHAGNLRVYSDRDLLLFGSRVNATLEIIGDADRYISCAEAKKMACGLKAECFDQCHAQGPPRCFGKCSCKPGFSGNEFHCMKTELLTEHFANGTTPTGLVLMAETGSSSVSDEELVGRDEGESASHGTPQPGGPQYAPGTSQVNPQSVVEAHMNGQVAMALLMGVLMLGCLLLVQAVWRGRLMSFFLSYRRRRTRPAFDPEDPVALHRRRLQAWTHQLDGRHGGRGGVDEGIGWQRRQRSEALSEDEAELIAWVTAMSERDRDADERRGQGRGRMRFSRPLEPPQAPAPAALPAHLRNPKPTLPGVVEEEIAEGSECAVCMVCAPTRIPTLYIHTPSLNQSLI